MSGLAKPPEAVNRAVAYPLTYLFVMGGYLVAQHAAWNPAHPLPLTAIDKTVPFLPWTGWIYATVFFFPLLAVWLVRDDRGIRAILAAFLAVTTVCFAFFLLYPTVYPRPELAGGGLLSWPLELIYRLDLPSNCFPSGHVTAAFLTAFAVRRSRPELGKAVLSWAVLIAASTLTTKQHYFWDVAAGFGLSAAGYHAALRYFEAAPSLPALD